MSSDESGQQQPGDDVDERTMSRRSFLMGVKGWSAAVACLALCMGPLAAHAEGGWVNRAGRGGWVNGAGGGGSWVNRRGGWINGGGSWVNRAGGGWVNRAGGGGWINAGGGGGWVNRRGGGGWINRR